MNQIPVILIHGTLGSGKTTLVQSLLESESFVGSFVIENEFADVNVDATTLEDHVHDHHNVYSIAGGCICCSSGEELGDALRTIVARKWQKPVIIETTGVASSVQLIQKLFLNPDFLEHFKLMKNVYVIDPLETVPEELLRLHALDVRLADVVVITKSDLTGPDTINDIRNAVSDLSPEVLIDEVVRGAVDPSMFQGTSQVEDRLVAHIKDLAMFSVPEHGVTYTVRTVPPGVTKEDIAQTVASLQKDPEIGLVRVKGYFSDTHGSWWHLEATRTHSEILEATPKPQAVMVFIGSGVKVLHASLFDTK